MKSLLSEENAAMTGSAPVTDLNNTKLARIREQANLEAFARLSGADPVLVDVRPAGEVIPGFGGDTILTSGAPLEWSQYIDGQRRALIYGAIYEGLAASEEDADQKFADGTISIGACHDYGCVGSVAGIYTASMPVFVVENRAVGNLGFCNFFEGASRRRLNYGIFDDTVRKGLDFIRDVVAPTIADAVKRAEGIELKPIMARALHMGDELHSRNTAATVLFFRELFPYLFDTYEAGPDAVRRTTTFLKDNDYFFLRLSMAAAKSTADSAHGIEGSSVVSAMTLSCREFALRVSGLGGTWFRGPLPSVDAKLFDDFTEKDIQWIGGESHIAETVGLGGFAQAAAFPLQAYQGGTARAMAEMNDQMYEITTGENEHFRIPYFDYRGTPTGIDIFRVKESGVLPVIDAGLAGRDGGQIGAGILRPPMDCFELAIQAYNAAYAS